jgi:hypothetical protein
MSDQPKYPRGPGGDPPAVPGENPGAPGRRRDAVGRVPMRLVALVAVLALFGMLAAAFLAASAPAAAVGQRYGFGIAALACLAALIFARRRLRAKRYERLMRED